MSERYKVVEGSESAHCCFKATVVDTHPNSPFYDESNWVCECFDMETAQKIADAMNAAPQPAEQSTISAYACTVPDDCETLHWRGQILSLNELASVTQPVVDEEIHVNIEGGDVLTLPLASSGMSAPRFVVHVPAQPADQQPALAKYQPCGCVVCTCEHETRCQGCGAHHCGTRPAGQIPEPVYQQPAPDVAGLDESPINVIYTDGCGAGRRSPADCRYGISYVTVADTVYWPLSADDAQRLRSAECGRGDFTGPANECPECPGLVEALKQILGWRELRSGQEFPIERIEDIAHNALAAHRKGGEV